MQFKLPVRRIAAAFALRQRMLNFVQNIQYYMMFEVMEPTWHVMENNLKMVSDIPSGHVQLTTGILPLKGNHFQFEDIISDLMCPNRLCSAAAGVKY